jgi:lauroyl/myristoyl acyltransferase
MLRSAYYGMVAGLSRVSGFRGSEPLAAVLARVRYSFNGAERKVYLGHLARVFPDLGRKDLERILLGYWRVHQRAFLGLFLAARLNPGNIVDRVVWSGRDQLDAALTEGRGVVLAVPHFGDERMLHILLAMSGYPMHVISSRYLEASEYVRRARLGVSMKWHHVGFPDEHPAWIYKALRRGEVVQIAPTAWGGPRGHWVRIFGIPVLASSTPIRLAASTGCALVIGCNHALPGGRYRVELTRFSPGSLDREGTANLFEKLQQLGKDYPEQYNWMNLVIRHRETNTIARLGCIPSGEHEVEEAAMPEDLLPENIRDYSEVSVIGRASL